jgi:DegV family protein with EDD domain
MQIITDSAALLNRREGTAIGVDVIPLSVIVDGHNYLDLEELDGPGLLDIIEQGHFPTTSQPSVGDTLEVLQKHAGQEILYITMADGISGTYQSALSAREMMEHPDAVHILNSRTLCGPQRYLVEKAVVLAQCGKSAPEIIEALQECQNSARSFLIPQDFGFLKRGGRISSVSATLGGMLHVVPLVCHSLDGLTLNKFGIKRTYQGALKAVTGGLEVPGDGSGYRISISHACACEKAQEAAALLSRCFPGAELEVLALSPLFITHGGPGCVAIQSIKK